MDWDAADFHEEDPCASDAQRSDHRAFRCEMTWRVPGPVVALWIIWCALRALARLAWSFCRGRVLRWFHARMDAARSSHVPRIDSPSHR